MSAQQRIITRIPYQIELYRYILVRTLYSYRYCNTLVHILIHVGISNYRVPVSYFVQVPYVRYMYELTPSRPSSGCPRVRLMVGCIYGPAPC